MRSEASDSETRDSGDDDAEKRPHLAFLAVLTRLPKKKLIVLGSLALLILLAIVGVIALAVTLLKKPKAPPAPAAPPPPVEAPLPARPAAKPGVEERFEAIKRGDLSGIPRRHTTPTPPPLAAPEKTQPETAPSAAPAPTTPTEPVPTSKPDSGKAAPEKLRESPPAAAKAPPPAAKTSPLTKQGGCEVGTADAKGSAASILDCVRFFNELEGNGNAKPKPKK